MKRNFLKPIVISMALIGFTISSQVQAEMVNASSDKTQTIKGYYPSFDSIGTSIFFGTPGAIKVGDIIGLSSDMVGSDFFKLVDMDGDFPIPVNGGEYSVAWWAVKPKEGYKWADETGDLSEVREWSHVDAVLIPDIHYVKTANTTTSQAVQIPGGFAGSRIAFSIVPETELGDPNKGQALYAPDINFFWKNSDPNQKPGMPLPGQSDHLKPESNGLIPQRLSNNPTGGGNTLGDSKFAAVIYEDINNDGIFTPGVDVLLTDAPKVNTQYVVDIKIFKSDGTSRPLNEKEQESIVWDFYLGENIIKDAGEGLGSYSFKTQINNASVSDIIKSFSPSGSQQGLSLRVNFEFDDAL
ncbi:hypothetical protein [Thorsellia kenyensis]|uniref:Uncharacterized protein n=1 Tax=Thorsellia kenyensis TaxID=1549888 RepID=A0ABV6CCR5_9GAMM